MADVKTRIKLRSDSASNWTTAQSDATTTPVLAAGEIGYIASGTGAGYFKIGDGTTLWGALPYAPAGAAVTATTATNVASNTGAGALVYQSNNNTTTTLAAGADGQSLILVSGAPSWVKPTITSTYFSATTSAELRGVISDETGGGSLVFATSPTLTTPTIGSGGATFNGSSSGSLVLRAAAAASGTLNIPAPGGGVTETLVTSETVATNYLSKTSTTTQNVAASVSLASGKTLTAPNITASGTVTLSGLSDGVVKSTSGVLSGANTVTLTSEVSGTLPIANGGTGATTATGARQNMRIFVQSTEPSSPVEGDIWLW